MHYTGGGSGTGGFCFCSSDLFLLSSSGISVGADSFRRVFMFISTIREGMCRIEVWRFVRSLGEGRVVVEFVEIVRSCKIVE